MSMQLTLARIDAALLAAIRDEPRLLDRILGGDDRPLPAGLAKTFNPGDVFSVDYRSLDAIAAAMQSRVWFDRATGGTETVDYDMNYGSAFMLNPARVGEIAAGLAAEGWAVGSSSATLTGETDADVDRSAHALGEAADWDPDEIEAYGPMMAATGSSDFNVKVVRAVGTRAGWDADTVNRVAAAVATAEPEELVFDEEYDLAGFFGTAAQAGQGIVGGID